MCVDLREKEERETAGGDDEKLIDRINCETKGATDTAKENDG